MRPDEPLHLKPVLTATETMPADEGEAWLTSDGRTLRIVYKTGYLVKLLRGEGEEWIPASIRIPVDDRLLDPAWADRQPTAIPDSAKGALARANSALQSFVAARKDVDGA